MLENQTGLKEKRLIDRMAIKCLRLKQNEKQIEARDREIERYWYTARNEE